MQIQISNNIIRRIDLQLTMVSPKKYYDKHYALDTSYIFQYPAHSVQLSTFEFTVNASKSAV